MARRRAAGPRADDATAGSRSPTACASAPGPRSPRAWTVTDRRAVDALSPFYVWTPDYAEKRLAWKRRHPLHVLLLRTYRIPRPVTVRVRDDYGGCRSWLEITRDLPFEGTPVLSDEEFERASEEIAGDRRTPTARSRTRLNAARSGVPRGMRLCCRRFAVARRRRVLPLTAAAAQSAQLPALSHRAARRPAPTRPTTARASATSCRPGTRGRYNAARARRLPGHRRDGPALLRPAAMYRDLVYATPGLKADAHPELLQGRELRRRPTDRPSGPTRRAPT